MKLQQGQLGPAPARRPFDTSMQLANGIVDDLSKTMESVLQRSVVTAGHGKILWLCLEDKP